MSRPWQGKAAPGFSDTLYEIGGQQLTDYWFYAHRRWGFDLVLSNPDSVSLYRMTAQQYVKAAGCAH
jgi:hypothetical protein